MGCPNCNKQELVNLTVCLGCRVILENSICQESPDRINPLQDSEFLEIKSKIYTRGISSVHKPVNQIKLKPSPKSITTKPSHTAEIVSKETNQTLVKFQNDIPEQMPKWRLKLKNTVQQRLRESQVETVEATSGGQAAAVAFAPVPTKDETLPAESETIEEKFAEATSNPYLARALQRIESSRNKFLVIEPEETPENPEIIEEIKTEPPKNHSLKIATRNDNPIPTEETVETKKPRLVPNPVAKPINLYDTSELDPEFVPAKYTSSLDKDFVAETSSPKVEERFEESIVETKTVQEVKTFEETTETKNAETNETSPKPTKVIKEEDVEFTTVEVEEFDDSAPFTLRFNAGLFDLLIGSFVSLILLSPLTLVGGEWFSTAGLFAFIATCAIVMFIYLTTAISSYGKTFGMQLFSLEMVDIDGEYSPNIHQAAVSSSVYLLSMAFGGIGFLTAILDKEKRAVHDMASKTIVIREY